MGGLISAIVSETTGMSPPTPPCGAVGAFLCGLINCFFFGWGTIIDGLFAQQLSTVCIGILQCIIPFVGWIWSIIWAVLFFVQVPILSCCNSLKCNPGQINRCCKCRGLKVNPGHSHGRGHGHGHGHGHGRGRGRGRGRGH